MRANYKKRIVKSIGLFFVVTGVIFIGGFVMEAIDKNDVFTSSVVSERVLIPGGQSVGIEMSVKGALIVGVQWDFGPEVGDMIVSVNGKKVETARDVESIVCDTDSEIPVVVTRKGKKITYDVKPKYDKKLEKYKLGLWVKEKIAGIGTLSFYDPKTNKYAALGHGIYETETNTLLKTKEGNLLETEIENITEGEEGTPGQLGGVFYNCDSPIGTIDKNSQYGIYGESNVETMNIDLNNPIVMGFQDQIETGKAYILTTVDENKVEKFEIEITKVNHQRKIAPKGIEFQVTDERLISRCGGIIQGMSGSPIIQNNRLIGAVTHVLVDEPLKGYGIFAQWMIEELEKK